MFKRFTTAILMLCGTLGLGLQALSAQGTDAFEVFRLTSVVAICQCMPTGHPFQGGDCRPGMGTVIVVTTESGALIGTCEALPDDPNAITASCTVTVPAGTTVIVSEDISKLPPGYQPRVNPQRWDISDGPPDGIFGGPVFINLPSSATGTPGTEPTGTPIADLTPAACRKQAVPTPNLDMELVLDGYVAIYRDAVFFLHWVERDGTLGGSLRLTYWQNDQSAQPISRTVSFSGYRSNNDLTLWLSESVAGTDTLPGTLEDDEVTVYLPAADGSVDTIDTIEFDQGTLAEYDQAVATIQQHVDQALTCSYQIGATATAIADRQAAVTAANARLRTALDDLEADLDSLSDSIDDLRGVLDDSAAALEDMQELERDMREMVVVPLDCFALDDVRFALDDVGFARDDMSFVRDNLDYAADYVTGDMAAVEDQIAEVEAAYQALERAVAANSSGFPVADFDAEEVSAATGAAQDQLTLASGALDEAEQTASGIDQQADALLDDATAYVDSLTCVEE